LNTCEIDSIIVVNRTANPLLLDISILREIDTVPTTFYFARQIALSAYGKQELINLIINNQGYNYTDTLLYLENGDTMFANSDFVNNIFDCLISYRGFTEV